MGTARTSRSCADRRTDVAFLDPKKLEEDDALPGSGVHLDLEVTVCPDCGTEAPPWEDHCPDCGVATVDRSQIRPPSFDLPGLAELAEDDASDEVGAGSQDAGSQDDAAADDRGGPN